MVIHVTEKGLNGEFRLALSRATIGFIRDFATERKSNQWSEKYAGIGQAPGLKKFKGEHQFAELGEQYVTVDNEVFTGGIEVPKYSFLYDKTGDITQRFSDLATQVGDHKDDRILEVLKAGHTTGFLCYDGKKLFDTSRKFGKSTSLSNDIGFTVQSTSAITPIEFGQAVLFGIRKMLAITDDQKRHMNRNARRFKVLVPLELLEVAMAAMNNDVLQGSGGAVDNTFKRQNKFSIEIEAEPQWDQPLSIVIARVDGPKPIILQELRGMETFMHGPGRDCWDIEKVLRYGVEIATGVAPFWWQSIQRLTFTGA